MQHVNNLLDFPAVRGVAKSQTKIIHDILVGQGNNILNCMWACEIICIIWDTNLAPSPECWLLSTWRFWLGSPVAYEKKTKSSSVTSQHPGISHSQGVKSHNLQLITAIREQRAIQRDHNKKHLARVNNIWAMFSLMMFHCTDWFIGIVLYEGILLLTL